MHKSYPPLLLMTHRESMGTTKNGQFFLLASRQGLQPLANLSPKNAGEQSVWKGLGKRMGRILARIHPVTSQNDLSTIPGVDLRQETGGKLRGGRDAVAHAPRPVRRELTFTITLCFALILLITL